jgi:hypothetical protein
MSGTPVPSGRRSPRRFFRLVPLLLFCALLGGCGGDDGGGTGTQISNPEDFLPREDVSNWQLTGIIETGVSYDDLYAVINGGAEIYDGHGMHAFASADYDGLESLAGAIAEIWIYEMDTPQGATNLYEDPQIAPSSEEAIDDLGTQARTSPILGGRKCEFIRDNYYVSVVVAQTSLQDAEVQATFLAGHVDGEIVQ